MAGELPASALLVGEGGGPSWEAEGRRRPSSGGIKLERSLATRIAAVEVFECLLGGMTLFWRQPKPLGAQ